MKDQLFAEHSLVIRPVTISASLFKTLSGYTYLIDSKPDPATLLSLIPYPV
jgi:hypothetical protein